MTVYADLGAWALATLRATPGVVGLVVGGAARILEAGEIALAELAAAQNERREHAENNRVLEIMVQDLGEEGMVSRCVVHIHDRYGYTNIRTAREEVIKALVNQPAALARDAFVIAVQYESRSGHTIAEKLDADMEYIIFSGTLVAERDSYM